MELSEIPKPEQVDEVSRGLSCEWFFDKQIVVYRVTMVSPAIIETWSDMVVDIIQKWDKNRPYLAQHDLSKPGVSLQYASLVGFDTTNLGINAQGRQKVEAILDAHTDFFAHIAINFSLSLSGQVNKLLANRRNANPFIQYKMFYDQERSFSWLAESLQSAER